MAYSEKLNWEKLMMLVQKNVRMLWLSWRPTISLISKKLVKRAKKTSRETIGRKNIGLKSKDVHLKRRVFLWRKPRKPLIFQIISNIWFVTLNPNQYQINQPNYMKIQSWNNKKVEILNRKVPLLCNTIGKDAIKRPSSRKIEDNV